MFARTPGRVLNPYPRESEAALGAIASTRLEAALAAVGRPFSEPDLNILEIARSQNLSPRHLHRLLESTGRSFSAHVNELRLARALELLQDGSVRRRIADIALI